MGRDRERAEVSSLLDSVGLGPAWLRAWGEAGIGKTTVLQAGISDARERRYRVLASSPAEAEPRESAGDSEKSSREGTVSYVLYPRSSVPTSRSNLLANERTSWSGSVRSDRPAASATRRSSEVMAL